jgi:hypothetical protein
MKNDKENTENVTIETNNDAVLYSVMLSFLKRKAKKHNIYIEHLTLSVDEENKTIEVFSDRNSKGEIGSYLIEEIEI